MGIGAPSSSKVAAICEWRDERARENRVETRCVSTDRPHRVAPLIIPAHPPNHTPGRNQQCPWLFLLRTSQYPIAHSLPNIYINRHPAPPTRPPFFLTIHYSLLSLLPPHHVLQHRSVRIVVRRSKSLHPAKASTSTPPLNRNKYDPIKRTTRKSFLCNRQRLDETQHGCRACNQWIGRVFTPASHAVCAEIIPLSGPG